MNTNIAKKLTGKVALVTGGSRSIGAAIARRLAADGASVALTYSASPCKADEVVRSIEAAGGKALAIKADAVDTEAVRLAVAKTIGTFGGIDILVNNAGTGIFAPIEQFSLEDFDKLIAVNVRGLFVATQEAARHLREGGRIIHIGSTNSERMPFAGGSVYALTKAAVAGFTRGVARDLGPRGITVNNVQPGPTDADINPAGSDFANTRVAKTARLFGVPTILTTVVEERGGFLIKGLQDVFPEQKPINRTFINTWEDSRVVDAVKKTGRKKVIMAALWTEICLAMPAIQALGEGYEVYIVTDASGGVTIEAHDMAMRRMVQAGAVPMTWMAVQGELQRDWARESTVPGVAEILAQHGGGSGVAFAWEMQLLAGMTGGSKVNA